MGLLLVLLVSLLAATAAVVTTAAVRNGLILDDQSAEMIASRVSRQRRHIAEAAGVHPHHHAR